MKKIFILITILLNLTMVYRISNNTITKASTEEEISKPLIVKQGCESYEYLEYDGYDIISSNVNFKKCGTYKVIYKHRKLEYEIEKIVYVKSKEELLTQETYCENYKTLLTLDENIIVTNVKKFNDSYYISYQKRLEDEKLDLGFMKITNNTIKFDKTLFSDTSGLITDFIINDEEIVLMIDKANIYSYLDTYYIVMTHDGKMKYSYKYVGDNSEESSKLLESSDYYYLVLDSYSSDDGDYLFQHTSRSGVVFVVEKGTNRKYKLFDITNNGDEVDVIDAINVDEQVYVLYKTYNSKLSLMELNVAHIDTLKGKLEITNVSLDFFEYPKFIRKDDQNNIYIVTSAYSSTLEDYVSRIYKLNDKVKAELIFEYQYSKEGNCNLSDVIIEDNNFTMVYSIVTNNTDSRYGYLYQIINNNSLKVEFEDFSATSMVNGFVNSNEILFIDDNNICIDYINYTIFTDLLEEQIYESNKNLDINIPTLFANGKNILIDTEKSKLEHDLKKYGKYNMIYYFNCDNVDVITNGTIEVLPYTNIYDGGVFDLNTRIISNGITILNSRVIESGYKIEECGTYTLELKSNTGEVHKIEFEIADLSNNDIKLKEKKLEYSEKEDYVNNTNSIQVLNHLIDDNFVRKTNNILWLVLIPFSSIIGLCVVLFNRR